MPMNEELDKSKPHPGARWLPVEFTAEKFAEAEAAADFEIAELFYEMGAAAGDEDLSR